MNALDALTKKYSLTVNVTLRDEDYNIVYEVSNVTSANVFALNSMQKDLGKATGRLIIAATEGEAHRLRDGEGGGNGRDEFAQMLMRAMNGGGHGVDVDEDGDGDDELPF
jgi:hypothetical protein